MIGTYISLVRYNSLIENVATWMSYKSYVVKWENACAGLLCGLSLNCTFHQMSDMECLIVYVFWTKAGCTMCVMRSMVLIVLNTPAPGLWTLSFIDKLTNSCDEKMNGSSMYGVCVCVCVCVCVMLPCAVCLDDWMWLVCNWVHDRWMNARIYSLIVYLLL